MLMLTLLLGPILLSDLPFTQITSAVHLGDDIYAVTTRAGTHHAFLYDAGNDEINKTAIRNGGGPEESRGLLRAADCGDGTLVFLSADGKLLHYTHDFEFLAEHHTIYIHIHSLSCTDRRVTMGYTSIVTAEQLTSDEKLIAGVSLSLDSIWDVAELRIPCSAIFLGNTMVFRNNPIVFVRYFVASLKPDEYLIAIKGSPVFYVLSDELQQYTYEHPKLSDAGHIATSIETNLPMKIEFERIPYYSITHQRWVTGTGYVNFEVFENKLFIKELFFNYQRGEMDFYAALRVDSPIGQNLEQMDDLSHSRIMPNRNNPFIEEIKNLELFESNFEIVNMADLRRDLEMEKSLEEQFQDNSGRPFFYRIYPDGTKRLGHAGEITYETTREFRNRFLRRNNQESLQPSLEIYDRWKDFGKVQMRVPLVAEYTIVNTSENAVNILSVNPACVFSKYEIDETTIMPGQSTTLSVHLTPSFNGYLKEYIIIETDTDERFYSFVFEADIK